MINEIKKEVVGTRVFDVIETRFEEIREDKEKIIFERIAETEITEKMEDDAPKFYWVYHAPNAQNHDEKQVEAILKKLKELNTRKS